MIGGGIYGCHFAQAFNVACSEASSILNKAIGAKLVIFEKDDTLFSQASGKNSFRIHKGFHYPRTGNTRSMCYNDHNKFVHQYPHFFQTAFDEEKNKDNPAFSKVFAIAKDDKTKLDYDAMRNRSMEQNIKTVSPCGMKLTVNFGVRKSGDRQMLTLNANKWSN